MPKQDWIRTALKERGLKLKNVAETLGIPAPRVTDILKGARGVQSHEILPFSRLLGMNTRSLLESLKRGEQTYVEGADQLRLPILGSLTGSGVVAPPPGDISFDGVPLPPDADTPDGLYCYVMGDDSMAREISSGSLVIAADPKRHFAPIAPGALLLIDLGNGKRTLRQYTKSDRGEDWLVPLPESPNPDFASWRFSLLSHLMPGSAPTDGTEKILRIDNVLARVLWVHQRHAPQRPV